MLPTMPDRRIILVTGPREAGLLLAKQLIQRSNLTPDEVYHSETEEATSGILGQDISLLVVDAYNGLNPDFIGRASGAIRI